MAARPDQAVPGIEFYHVGLVVDDVARTVDMLNRFLGVKFLPLQEHRFDVIVDGVVQTAEVLGTYSVSGAPRLELIEEKSGGIWSKDGRINHIGFWASDLGQASQIMNEYGLSETVSHNAESPTFCYHKMTGGLWIELVSDEARSGLEAWTREGNR